MLDDFKKEGQKGRTVFDPIGVGDGAFFLTRLPALGGRTDSVRASIGAAVVVVQSVS